MTGPWTKRAFLHLARALGLFAIARRLTAKSVRLLCYHGISIDDQHEFEPLLFMPRKQFEHRLALLAKRRWKVVTLDQALAALESGTVNDAPVVITIDDGWSSTISQAVPALRRAGMPATLYVATQYLASGYEVFDVILQYMFWKSRRATLELRTGIQSLDGEYDLTTDRRAVVLKLLENANRDLDEHGKQCLLKKLAEALALDFDGITSNDRFRLMSANDGEGLSGLGVDLQLHTHRHHLPNSNLQDMRVEIEDNRKILEAIKKGPCNHFCYPSGDYASQHPSWLASCGVQSATTCEPGFADSASNRLLLPRILDRSQWSDIEFEAVLSGFTALLSRLRSTVFGRG